MTLIKRASRDGRGFLVRLAKDKAGNALMLMAAAILPLCGLVGGAVDLSRLYMTKTRLQHACDAGALAGRKRMGGGTWTQDSNAPNTSAQQFFTGNFATGSYGSYSQTATFTENAGKVTGNASVVLPMTIMQIFGYKTDTIAVTCDAEMRLPNTDVMFVLDTTGSMASKATPSDTQTKIAGLKIAVKCFYEIVARLDTDANCVTGTPSGGTGDQVQIRFGFVPYAVNVNMGGVLDGHSDWMASDWSYQTRLGKPASGGWSDWSYSSYTAYDNQNCNTAAPANTRYVQYRATKQYYFTTPYCYIESRSKPVDWHYGYLSQDVSGLKNGTGFNSSVSIPVGDGGGNVNVNWDGCIEERQNDLDSSFTEQHKIDDVPTNDVKSQWGPMLQGAIFTRKATTNSNNGSTTNWDPTDIPSTSVDYGNTSYYQCPRPAVKLQQWPDASTFDAYVDSLTPDGNTHHDIGLLWGARLISPTGLFSTENAYTPKGGEIQRNVIFMTDGDTNSQPGDYGAWGVAGLDRRQTAKNTMPTDTTLNGVVNARTLSICTAIKNMKNTTLWVISYGTDFTAATQTNLKNCATDGRFFAATDSTKLQQTFAQIANEISQLRLTK